MTLRELVERELERAQSDAKDLLAAMESAKMEASRKALGDIDAMMLGGSLAHAALELAKLRTQFDAKRDQVSMLEYILRESDAALESN